MTKTHWAAIASAVVLFLVLYFGCETKPPQQKAVEKSRALAVESTDINALLRQAKEKLSPQDANTILGLEQMSQAATNDSLRLPVLEQLAGQWYQLGHPEISGVYAQEIADISGTESTWALAGTTYTICLQQSQDEKIRSFCRGRAIQAFESAISVNPENVAHKINLALVYTDAPDAENPMQGILMLRELNEQFPEEPAVLVQLGRLAIRTNQFERAVQRLEKAWQLDPENQNAVCLLAQAYQGAGQTEKAMELNALCGSSNK